MKLLKKALSKFVTYFKSVFEIDTLIYIVLSIALPWSIIEIANIYPGDKVTMVFMLVVIAMYFISIILICPILETNRQLRNILKETKKCKSFKELSNLIKQKKNYKIRNIYVEFEKNIKIKASSSGKEIAYAEVDSSYYLDEDNIIYNDLKTKTIDQISQSLTGVGIFGTFLGIVRGVSSLDVTSNDAMRNGIATLLSGVKVSFNSSLYGILASVILILMYKVLLDMTSSKINMLNNEINKFVQTDLEDLEDNELNEQIASLSNQIKELKSLMENKKMKVEEL